MVLHSPGESIECQRCEVITRKYVPSTPQYDKDIGHHIKYDLSLNCSTENKQELEPKEFVYRKYSNLELGTILRAKQIYILTTTIKPIKFFLINKSGRHKASKALINGFTFAEIKVPLQNVLNSIRKRKALK